VALKWKIKPHIKRGDIVISRYIISVFCVLILISQPALASSTEAETLSKIDHELTALSALIQTAKGQADATQRVVFDYKALEADLELVKQGIRRHVIAPRTQPREYPPLKGDYR